MSATKEYYFDPFTASNEDMEYSDYEYQEYMHNKEREDREETARILADRFGMNNEDWEV